MKKINILLFLTLFIFGTSICLDASPWDVLMRLFGFGQQEQQAQPVAPAPAVALAPTAPVAAGKRAEKRPAEVIDLTGDSDDETGVTAAAAVKRSRGTVHDSVLVAVPQQKDNWTCGYRAVFNGFAMLEAVLTGQDPRQADFSDYDAWFGQIRKDFVAHLPADGKWLGSFDAIDLLVNERLRGFDKKLFGITVVQSNADPKNLELKQKEKLYPENVLYENVYAYRRNGLPQLVLINTGNHWIALVLALGRVYAADSFNNINLFRDSTVTYIDYWFRGSELADVGLDIAADQRSFLGQVSATRRTQMGRPPRAGRA